MNRLSFFVLPFLVVLSISYSYSQTDTTSAYVKGFSDYKDFILQQVRYPALAAENGISGRVEFSFIITEKGCVDSIKILSSPDKMLSNEVIRLVKKTNCKWTPAESNGEPVKSKLNSHVDFKLQ